MKDYHEHLDQLLNLAIEAGDLIMSFYEKPVNINYKKDSSPVTEADLLANQLIVHGLQQINPVLPIIAEENEESIHVLHGTQNLVDFWLVDPIDGTNSFINHTGQFTVNIALIENNSPTLGIIYHPSSQTLYYTNHNKAYRHVLNYHPEQITVKTTSLENGVIMITSHRKLNQEAIDFIQKFKVNSTITVPSSIKFCLLAEGKADIYPRFGQTMEWDTAAGQAILTKAGGKVIDLKGNEFSYGKKDFLNSDFIAYGCSALY